MRVRRALVSAALALACVAWAGARAARAYAAERESMRAYRYRVVRPDGPFGRRLRDVTFPARDGRRVYGWYVPPSGGPAVVLCHGSGGDRTEMLDEARALVGAGAGVLLYDGPGHGQTPGVPTYGAPERAALAGALDFLSQQPEVDRRRVAALGFSIGGVTVAQVAAGDPRVRAAVLVATPGDLAELTRAEYGRGGPFALLGARLAQSAAGFDAGADRPLDLVARVAPRPLLVVAGARDPVVPAAMARALYDAARPRKQLLVVDAAGHGHYARADPAYAPALVSFIAGALPAR